MKNIKLFEQYSEELDTEMEITNSIFEDWKSDNVESLRSIMEGNLYESGEDDEDEDWGADDEELTSGEKAALARDFQIMSKSQLAAIYLRALGKVKDNNYNAYTVMIDGIQEFGETDREGNFKITVPGFADAIGLDSNVTVSRTSKKFRNLISGEGETSGEAIYPKIIRAFNQFSSRTPREVAMLASEAIQDPMMFTKNRDAAIEQGPRSAAKRLQQKETQIKTGEMVHFLVKALKNVASYRNEAGKAERMAISKISNELNIPLEKVALSYEKYLKSKGVK